MTQPAWEALRRDLSELANAIANRANGAEGRYVIAIDGPGCCGKSTLSDLLVERLGAAVLATDDFHAHRGYVPVKNAPLPYRRWPEFRQCVQALIAGDVAQFRPIDWTTHQLRPEIAVAPRPVIIIDGIGAMHPDVACAADLRIWVDGLAESRMARTAAREGRDMSLEWAEYLPLEQQYFATSRPWESADLFVLGAELSWTNTAGCFARLLDAGLRAA